MTAEIAILNKSAIAVAADSAVTRGGNKVHVTANKIFRISDCCPAGLMVYGNADVFGLPWELVAKLFRNDYGKESYACITDYAQALTKFFSSKFFLDDDSIERELVSLAFYLAAEIEKQSFGNNRRQLSKSISDNIAGRMDRLSKMDDLDGYPVPSKRSFSTKYGALCRAIFEQVFDELDISASAFKEFPELVRLMSGKKSYSDYMSGFVVFGFGEQDVFPGLQHFHIDGAPFGSPRLVPFDPVLVSRGVNENAYLMAFAQHETATTFMENVSHSTKDFFLKSMKAALGKFGQEIFKDLEKGGIIPAAEIPVYRTLFDKQIDEFHKAFRKETDNHLRNASIHPILNALDGLSKEDLAKLAESLVEITSLKLRVSGNVEVVGGPIDVAVLSRVDGFIWIKRKHYFEEKYNPHFFKRYLEGGTPIIGAR